MENKDTPAFPTIWDEKFKPDFNTENGFTKREYFAGLAMQGMITGRELSLSKEEADVIAGQSVQFADSLLKALEK